MSRSNWPPRRSRWLLPASTCLLVGLAAGCSQPLPVYYVVEAIPEEIVVPCEPPKPRLEIPPDPPSASCVWQAGYYHWDDDEWTWVDGSWVEPRPGYIYVGASTVYVDGGWHYRPPYWRHRYWHRRHQRHKRHERHERVAKAGPAGSGPHEGPYKHRAPSVRGEPHRHRAPAVTGPHKHRAPPVATEDLGPAPDPLEEPRVVSAAAVDPPAASELPPRADLDEVAVAPQTEKSMSSQARAAAASDAINPLPAAERVPVRRPRSIRIEPVVEEITDIHDPELQARIHDPDHVASLRDRPEFRGTRDGRMVFGDDPEAVRRPPEYPTDDTGAIVLASPRPMRVSWRPGMVRVRGPGRGGLVVHGVEPRGRTFSHVYGHRRPQPRMARPWRGQPMARERLLRRPEWRHEPRVRPEHHPPMQHRPVAHQRPVFHRQPAVHHRPPPRVHHRPPPMVHHRPPPRVHHRPPPPRVHHRPAPRVHHRPAPVRHAAPARVHVARGGRRGR